MLFPRQLQLGSLARAGLRLLVLARLGWSVAGAEPEAVAVPPEERVEWGLATAWRETTPTRERVCLNGLWRWQPAAADAASPPTNYWGWFKVPGPWPGITDYMQKDSQTMHAHPAWKEVPLREVTVAWYEREITVPPNWAGRRIALRAEYLNSLAVVFVDGRKVGELHFPADELDLTANCQPGRQYRLSLLVVALPLKGVLLSYTDSAAAREVKGSVARRGLCGDVFLCSTPPGARLERVQVRPSVRRWELAVEATLRELAPDSTYRLEARVRDSGRVVK